MFGLEEGVITPENSFIAWNGETYPFEAWNPDQTLQSAMNSSVNWYFQPMDEQLRADGGATGSNATEITMSILSDMNIWK